MMHPIPDEALDGRLAIVGISGSGKSTTAKGGVERLLAQDKRVCVVDLLDGWWGLRVKRDGKTPAFPVAIFGGRHGDLPLTEHAGALIGQAVAQSQESCVVSLADLDGDAARRRFALAFFDSLHRHNRAPLHLVIDEADFYAPQNPVKDGPGPLLLNRVKEIAARGRMRGFRCWLISQRPAKLHKDALSQADTLIAMQLTSTQDRKALEGWIGDQADKDTGKQILATLPRMKIGQGVLWSPRLGILKPTQFPLPVTYDSSRTPEYGEAVEAVSLSALDLGALKERLSTVEAEAKANDPKALRAEIAALKRQVAQRAPDAAKPDPYALERAADDGYRRGFADGHAKAVAEVITVIRMARERADETAGWLKAEQVNLEKLARSKAAIPSQGAPSNGVPKAPSQVKPVAAIVRADGEKMAGGERRILTALAQYPNGRTKRQVAILTGYAINGGGFNNNLSALRTKGWMDGRGDDLRITEPGLSALGSYEPLPSGRDLLDHWLRQLDKAPRLILETLATAYPDALTKEQVAERAGYEPNGGGFNNALSRLRTLELIEGRGELRASEDLF